MDALVALDNALFYFVNRTLENPVLDVFMPWFTDLNKTTSGRILLDGEDVAFKRASERDIAFVFQLFALYPHMNVRKNIGFPLKCQGVPRAEVRRRVEEVARMLAGTEVTDKTRAYARTLLDEASGQPVH